MDRTVPYHREKSDTDEIKDILNALIWHCDGHGCNGYRGRPCQSPQRDICHILLGFPGWVCSCPCHTPVDGMQFKASFAPRPDVYRRMLEKPKSGSSIDDTVEAC